MPRMRDPKKFHALVALALCLLGTVGLGQLFGGGFTWPPWLAGWLVAVNVLAFSYYGYDKRQAVVQGRRIPEIVLQGLAAVGGSPGAFLGMRAFRHKTVKGSFRILFWGIVIVQIALIAWAGFLLWRE